MKAKDAVTAQWGKRVRYCGHDASFAADITFINGAAIVRANGPISEDNLRRPAGNCDYHMVDMPHGGVWSPHSGLFAVPVSQFRKL